MRYTPLSKETYIEHRKRFVTQMKPNSVAVFFSNDIMPDSADAYHGFKQNPDIFWLTGIDQEETMLVLYPDAPDEDWKEMLFIRETNEQIATWEGYKYTQEQARELSGINLIFWNNNFWRLLKSIMHSAERVYLNLNEHNRYASDADYGDMRWVREIQKRWPIHTYERAAPIMHKLRAIKSPEEVQQIRKACQITKKGFERLMRVVKPGIIEYELEAELAHEFLRNGSRGFAYDPIIAGGANSNVLHYVTNDQALRDGDLLLLDIGCEYGGYASDLTRVIPVNGRFNERQKEVYKAVLRVHEGAKEMLKPGNRLKEFQVEVAKIMEKELVDLGLLTAQEVRERPAGSGDYTNQKWPKAAYFRFFPHGTSHYLGLNVHDVGSHYAKFEPGMVFTCEPGIYIKEEGLGIRIENDILITANGNDDLMADIPITVEQIEDFMNP